MFVKSIKAAALAAVIAAPISAQAAQAVRASSATLSAPTASAPSDLTTATRAGPVMPDGNQLEGTPLWLILVALGVIIVGGIILFDGDGDASPN